MGPAKKLRWRRVGRLPLERPLEGDASARRDAGIGVLMRNLEGQLIWDLLKEQRRHPYLNVEKLFSRLTYNLLISNYQYKWRWTYHCYMDGSWAALLLHVNQLSAFIFRFLPVLKKADCPYFGEKETHLTDFLAFHNTFMAESLESTLNCPHGLKNSLRMTGKELLYQRMMHLINILCSVMLNSGRFCT